MSLKSLRGLVSLSFLTLFFFSCSKEESVELNLPSMPSSGGTAIYALSVSAGECMNADVQGTYVKNTTVTAANKVDIEVSVNTIGTWTVNSAAITGFYFSGSGSFTAAGTQMISLMAHGTPTTVGTQTFTLIVGSTSCTFDVVVDSIPTGSNPVSSDYLPMTQGTWWSYDDGTGDTTKTVISGTKSLIGKTFQQFVNSYEGFPDTDTSFYRKDDASKTYYLFEDLSDLTVVTLANPQVEVPFLKDVLTTNTTWNTDFSATFTATGTPVTLRVKFTCINANATLTNINGNNFTNVYHIRSELQYGTAPMFTTFETVNLYYAKGVGLVKSDDGTDVETIRFWDIN